MRRTILFVFYSPRVLELGQQNEEWRVRPHGLGACSSSRPSNRDIAPLEFYTWLPAISSRVWHSLVNSVFYYAQ